MIVFSSISLVSIGLAWFLDRRLGEPERFHPLVGFGNLAGGLEREIRARISVVGWKGRLAGGVAVALLIIPLFLLAVAISSLQVWGPLGQVVMLYLALGGKSLEDHALRVYKALEQGDLEASRRWVGAMVSRDTRAMEPPEVARATVESVLENGCDAVFSAMFWFIVLGGPGAVLFRLANTLDAMWGYRNDRYRYFGWAAARLDDLLGYLPARLTAMTYLLLGHSRSALAAWRGCTQRKSPNATLVMAAGGGALGLRLGGGGHYHGQWQSAPFLGGNAPPTVADIPRAIRLVARGAMLWAILALFLGMGTLI
ncbi:MAG: cobalamin biosynthesis protein CobD [Magnetococcales bacterium]|nr:cobalamin biosynthesis protein CobD [Magnetococcales bacterium]